ncbi:MAG: transcription termination factor NusA, partial [Spirochaetaceae bacterium]|nr:transcription termination factor NusA [Spirochaetaceae bacterium]
IEDTLKAAYKKKFGTTENAVVKFSDDLSDVEIYSRKVIVEKVEDPVLELALDEALTLSPECEVGDEIDILLDPKDFDRSAVQAGKQTAHQSFSEIQKDSLYAEYKDKVGEIIIGYYQRASKKGDIFVDLGKAEGILPAKFQSPRETYSRNDRIKALIVDLRKTLSGLQVVLSRTDPEFVRSIVELEVPEVYDKVVEIHKIVREAGYRTKIAVYANRDDIDPVGACVGLKGVRIQAVIRELYGEKIDILKYDPDPRTFIKNALSPAEVTGVVIVDEDKKQAIAVVPESQFSLAIGKQGLNVRLANRLADWSIDVKTEEQYEEIDQSALESRKAAEELFSDAVDYEEVTLVSELPGIDERVAAVLKEHGIDDIDRYLEAVKDNSIASIGELTEEDRAAVQKALDENVEFVEEEAEEEAQAQETPEEAEESPPPEEKHEDQEYECPECGAKITADMTECPNCHIGISFEEYEDEE